MILKKKKLAGGWSLEIDHWFETAVVWLFSGLGLGHAQTSFSPFCSSYLLTARSLPLLPRSPAVAPPSAALLRRRPKPTGGEHPYMGGGCSSKPPSVSAASYPLTLSVLQLLHSSPAPEPGRPCRCRGAQQRGEAVWGCRRPHAPLRRKGTAAPASSRCLSLAATVSLAKLAIGTRIHTPVPVCSSFCTSSLHILDTLVIECQIVI